MSNIMFTAYGKILNIEELKNINNNTSPKLKTHEDKSKTKEDKSKTKKDKSKTKEDKSKTKQEKSKTKTNEDKSNTKTNEDKSKTPVEGIRYDNGNLYLQSTQENSSIFMQNNMPDRTTFIGYEPSMLSTINKATLSINGNSRNLDTLFLQSIKGKNTSHVHLGLSGDWHINSAKDKGKVLIQNASSNGVVAIGKGAPTNAKLTINGTEHKHGSLYLKSNKGPHTSHAHWGPNGNWYISSANENGKVVIQDTAPDGDTIIASNLTLKGGSSIHNPNNLNTFLPAANNQKNYIRGNTDIQGNINQHGPLFVATEVLQNDANSEQLVIGSTNMSNLRLGRHADYSWIQSHGNKPLYINTMGEDVYLNGVRFNEEILTKLWELVQPRAKRSGFGGALDKMGKVGGVIGASKIGAFIDALDRNIDTIKNPSHFTDNLKANLANMPI